MTSNKLEQEIRFKMEATIFKQKYENKQRNLVRLLEHKKLPFNELMNELDTAEEVYMKAIMDIGTFQTGSPLISTYALMEQLSEQHSQVYKRVTEILADVKVESLPVSVVENDQKECIF